MDVWTMIVIIVAIGAVRDIIKSGYNPVSNRPENCDEATSKILSCLKSRVENLETIVLEKDRNSRFTGIVKN